jgi:hypothetical protein
MLVPPVMPAAEIYDVAPSTRGVSVPVSEAVDRFGNFALLAWASRIGFRPLDPMKAIRHLLEFLFQLHDREPLLPRERQRRFLATGCSSAGW